MAASLGEIAQIQEQLGNIARRNRAIAPPLKLQRQIRDKVGRA
jgi:hypothetical protein